MIKNVTYITCLCLFLFTSNAWAESTSKQLVVKKSNIVTKTIGVKGMTCVGCEVTLERSIKKEHGVVGVKASASGKHAAISYDKTKTNETILTKTIEKMGYKPFKVIESK